MADEKPETHPRFRDHSSPLAFNIKNEQLLREAQIANEKHQLVRERLAHCARTEGVNVFVNCKELREQYMALCQDRYHGMIFPADQQPMNRQVPGLIVKPPRTQNPTM